MRLGWRNFKYKLGIGDEHVFATDDADSADLNPFSCGSLFGPRTDPAAGDIKRYAPTSAPSCSRHVYSSYALVFTKDQLLHKSSASRLNAPKSQMSACGKIASDVVR